MSRRNLLLGGSTLAAASTMSAGVTTRVAQAQQQPVPAPGRQLPNVLVIFGDDRHRECQRIFKRSNELRDAEHRPHRPRGH
jgi:hypothetical protein